MNEILFIKPVLAFTNKHSNGIDTIKENRKLHLKYSASIFLLGAPQYNDKHDVMEGNKFKGFVTINPLRSSSDKHLNSPYIIRT